MGRRGHPLRGALLIAVAVAMVMGSTVPSLAEPSASAPATSTPSPASAESTSSIPVDVDGATAEFREELARRQAALEKLKAQLDDLDRELAISAESYNAASEELATTRQRLQVTQGDLSKAQAAYDVQSRLLASRANAIYRSGDMAAIEILLESASLPDLLERIRFLHTIGMKDADIARQLAAQRDEIEKTAQELKTAETKAQSLEFDLKARQIEIMLRIEDRQKMLASAQKEVLELLVEEATRRQALEAQWLQDILAGASRAGVDVIPGTPVETALAYHGVPYLWGGETPSGFDCSGLVLYVFRQHGVTLPHYSGSQFQLGERVPPSDLRSSDVVFFGSPIHHVGIYLGAGYYIHAPRTGDFVKVSRLADRRDYAGARRYPWVLRTQPVAGLSERSPRSNHNSGVPLTP